VWFGLAVLSAAVCAVVCTGERLAALGRFPALPRFEFWCVAAVGVIASLLGLVAVAAPPNNADSMIYHMARVMHWVQNQSVAHYPTSIPKQLFQPPWAEFAILQFQVLSRGDQWANLVQWFSMAGSVIGVSLIAGQLGADARAQVLAAVITATIPMGILQASSTQNDYVTSFWLVCLTHYVLQFRARPSRTNATGVAASLALALLTKGTAYLYAFPLVTWWAFSALRRLRWRAWQHVLVTVCIVLGVNMGHYARNFELWRNPLGVGEEAFQNEAFRVSVVVSNVIRNISLHMSTPSGRVNRAILKGIRILHVPLGIDASDPRTTFRYTSHPFDINRFSTLEDLAGNPVHLGLMMISLVLLFASREQRTARDLIAYATTLVVSFLVFCLYLKWQPWHSRLQLPLFVLWSPLIALVLFKGRGYRIGVYVVPLLMAGSTWYVFRNEIRPFVGIGPESTVFNTSRTDRLLKRHSDFRDQYVGAAHFVEMSRCSSVGLLIPDDQPEYPFWILLKQERQQSIRIEHVDVRNVSAAKARVSPYAGFSPCAVVVVDADDGRAAVAERGGYAQAWSSGPVRVLVRRGLW
jgi:hypothetical protein